MRRRSPIVLLFVGALLVLASLYLPWQEARGQGGGDLLYFGPPQTVDGWSSGIGQVAALSALVLAGVAAMVLARPQLVGRFPLGQCALFVGYFSLAVGAETRPSGRQLEVLGAGNHFHYAYGAYLGLASAVLVLLAGSAARREELIRFGSALQLASSLLAVGLLTAFMLPWTRGPSGARTFLGIDNPPILVAAAVTLRLLVLWWRSDPSPRAERLVLSAAAVLFTAGAFSYFRGYAYGAWLALGLAAVLVAVALVDVAQVSRPARPPWHGLATGAAAALFVASLFMPWLKLCEPKPSGCATMNGWFDPAGSAAAALAITLVLASFAPRRLASSVAELAAGLALFVATLGLQERGTNAESAYGAAIGFASAGLLVALAATHVRPHAFHWNRVVVRLVPMLASAAYLVVVVLPWFRLFPWHSSLSFSSAFWLTIVGALVAIRLLHLWARRVARLPGNPEWLLILPLALLALAVVDPVRRYERGMTWGFAIVVGLCLLLAWLGRVEQREGLENVRVPEILRVDRL